MTIIVTLLAHMSTTVIAKDRRNIIMTAVAARMSTRLSALPVSVPTMTATAVFTAAIALASWKQSAAHSLFLQSLTITDISKYPIPG